jgi:hypothetical protein
MLRSGLFKILIFSLSFWAAPLLCLALTEGSRIQSPSTQQEQNKVESLLRLPRNPKFTAHRRIIEELRRMAVSSQVARDALLRCLLNPELVDPYGLHVVEIAEALAQVEGLDIRAVIPEGLETDSRTLERRLILTGMMGTRAKSAIPFLLRELKEPEVDANLRGALRVVLAGTGYDSPENLKAIQDDITMRSDAGKGAVHMISLIGKADWINDAILSEIVKWLGKPDEVSADAALALGRLGPRARSAAARLKALLSAAQENEDLGTLRIVYGFALVTMNLEDQDVILRQTLKYCGTCGNHTDFTAMEYVARFIKPDLLKRVVEMLNDKDPEIVIGVVRMISAVGADAREAAPELIKIIESAEDDRVRESVPAALIEVADVSVIGRLQSLLGKERSPDVRERLEGAIEDLRLLADAMDQVKGEKAQ